eukprot:GGOE01018036.1.p1 GENE.GGOE01018036.1~~GGOE01018036.1.p1  ORF type:complete len:1311 (+),score=404.66 GGOE01018036.1:568-3933(+)
MEESPQPEEEKSLQQHPELEIDVIFACKKRNGVDQFFCKVKGLSHRVCSWLTEEEVMEARGGPKLKHFLQRQGLALPLLEEVEGAEEADEMYFDPQYTEVDRVIAEDEDLEMGQTIYLVKWKGLPYDQCTWEPKDNISDAQDAIHLYERRNQLRPDLLRRFDKPKASTFTEEFRRRVASDTRFKGDRHLRDYQALGYTWLLWCWANDRGCILGDEMGLGKTVQVVAFLNFLVQHYNRRGPYVIIAPLSTLPHWEREIEAWTDLNCVVFHGSEKARDMIIKHEFFFNVPNAKQRGHYKFHILLTTFEIMMREFERLKGIHYEAVVVDEGHKLKNKESAMFKTLSTLRADYRLMMTGTPVQNNISELWTLLSFLNPTWEWSGEDFLAEFGDLRSAEQLARLHDVIRPYLLRRTKEDVMKELPPKLETLIKVRLTSVQKMNYKAVLEGNREFLAGACGKMLPALSNVMMQLRKVCNHPYLLPGAEERAVTPLMTREERLELLVQSSSKLILLDKLLRKLQEGHHRVLIFSQMTRVLDILEDYMRFRDFKYERLDGNVAGHKRQQAIDRFQDDRYERFVFLLSTKAGGVGINLTKADTCIIYDSDWNPQNDLQAQARCHRIGQDKSVAVYRLLTENTYEEKMWEVASKKLGLDRAVLAGGRQEQNKPVFTAEQMNILLRHGAYELYKDSGREDDRALLEEDIDQILQRSTKIDLDAVNSPSASPVAPIAGLAGFSTAVFATGDQNGPEIDDENFWQKILPEAVSAMKLKQQLDGGPRLDADASRRFVADLRSLVELYMNVQSTSHDWAPTAESIQERETLEELLAQVGTHPSFTAQDKRGFARWLAILQRPRRRTAAAHLQRGTVDESEEEEAPSKPQPRSGAWRCPRCTLGNKAGDELCGACGARCPKSTGKKAKSTVSVAAEGTQKKTQKKLPASTADVEPSKKPRGSAGKGSTKAEAKSRPKAAKKTHPQMSDGPDSSPSRVPKRKRSSLAAVPAADSDSESAPDSDGPPPPKSRNCPKQPARARPKGPVRSGTDSGSDEEEALMDRRRRLQGGKAKAAAAPRKKPLVDPGKKKKPRPKATPQSTGMLYDEEDSIEVDLDAPPASAGGDRDFRMRQDDFSSS